MPSATDPVRRIASEPAVRRALAFIHRTDARTLDEQRTIALIPSSSFRETERAGWIAERLAGIGLARVQTDAAGNVLAVANDGTDWAEPVIVAAHLDTVFPYDLALSARIEGRRVYVPGIADNARGLAGMLAIARAIHECHVPLGRPLIFAATVGEEGVGDLRGVKHLFHEDSKLRRAAAFIALDGTDSRRIVTRAVGSTRFRVTVRGPGGHSWADRGSPNPAHAVGIVINALARLELPEQPPASLSVGRMGGGTSVNAIPEEAWLELDLRSEDRRTLADLERSAHAAIRVSIREYNNRVRPGELALEAQVVPIGSRPAGGTDHDARIVRAARGATRYIGRRPEFVASSTDANVPMALGIPAIAMGAGGESGGTHTLQEWYDNRRGPEGIVRALLTTVAAACDESAG